MHQQRYKRHVVVLCMTVDKNKCFIGAHIYILRDIDIYMYLSLYNIKCVISVDGRKKTSPMFKDVL